MGFLAALVRRAVVLSLAAFYAGVVVAYLAVRTIFKPSRPFWFTKKRLTPPKVLTDPNLGTHKYMQLEDINIHYVEKGDNTKPLILFVHGFPEFWYSWRHQIKEFSKDYWVVALDMRGYGDSGKPTEVEKYRMKYLVNDVKELVKALGREKFTLVAHDWGGAVAWQFVLRYPEMLEKYIIMNAPHPRGFPKYKYLSMLTTRQFFYSWYIFFFQAPYIPEILMRADDFGLMTKAFRKYKNKSQSLVTDEDMEAFKYTFSKRGAFTGPINYYRANIGPRTKTDLDAEQSYPPGLMVNGENDDYMCPELLTSSVKYVSDLKLEVIKGANHFVQQDDPEAVNKAMRAFLKE